MTAARLMPRIRAGIASGPSFSKSPRAFLPSSPLSSPVSNSMKRSMILSSWSSSSEVSSGRLGASGFGLRGAGSSFGVGSPDRKAASTTVRRVGVIGGSQSGKAAHFRGGRGASGGLRGIIAVVSYQPEAQATALVQPVACTSGWSNPLLSYLPRRGTADAEPIVFLPQRLRVARQPVLSADAVHFAHHVVDDPGVDAHGFGTRPRRPRR